MIILIITCKKNKERIEKIRETWLKDVILNEIEYYFLVGYEELEEAKIKDDYLYVGSKDNYEGLILKLAYAYKYLYENRDFDYIYKIDDDCFVNIGKLLKLELDGDYLGKPHHQLDIDRKWHWRKCENKLFEKNYVKPVKAAYNLGGFCYFLKRDVIKYIIDEISNLEEEFNNYQYEFEDKRMGEILFENGIKANSLHDYRTQEYRIMNEVRDNVVIINIGPLDGYTTIYEQIKILNLHDDQNLV